MPRKKRFESRGRISRRESVIFQKFVLVNQSVEISDVDIKKLMGLNFFNSFSKNSFVPPCPPPPRPALSSTPKYFSPNLWLSNDRVVQHCDPLPRLRNKVAIAFDGGGGQANELVFPAFHQRANPFLVLRDLGVPMSLKGAHAKSHANFERPSR